MGDLRLQSAVRRASRFGVSERRSACTSSKRRVEFRRAHPTSGDTVSPSHARGAIGASTLVAVAITSLSACNEPPTSPPVSINAAATEKASSSAYAAVFDDAALNKLRSDGGG